MNKLKLSRYPGTACLFFLMIFARMSFAVNPLYAATIGGNIYTGSAITLPDGSKSPNYDMAAPLNGASVMVQTMGSGGKFVTYGTVTNNQWSAVVPDGFDYVIMFSAPGHDSTSREYPPGDPAIAATRSLMAIDAYLPPVPLPNANLLVYAFYDNYINTEDDAPVDPPLNGVKFTVKDEDGNVLAVGYTGTQTAFQSGTAGQPLMMADGNVLPSTDGHYYFEGLPPGEVVVTSDASEVYLYPNPQASAVNAVPLGRRDSLPFTAVDQFYQIATEEGGHSWDPKLYPGDPGTFGGVYMLWHAYVKKMGQLPNSGSPINGIITGTCEDADPAYSVLAPGEALQWPKSPGVTANRIVPDCLVVLYNTSETMGIHPVATAEADPVTGKFTFYNVRPGKYKIFVSDLPLQYVWQQRQINVFPGTYNNVPLLLVPRFYGRAQGYVMDTAGNPLPGARVKLRYKSGTVKKVQYTDANGWYNFDSLPEIEVLGQVDVDLEYLNANNPGSYRGAVDLATYYPQFNGIGFWSLADPLNPVFGVSPQNLGTPSNIEHNQMNRYISWLTANYRADLIVEEVPAAVGQIHGNVFIDTYKRPQFPGEQWVSDGKYNESEERTFHGAKVELYRVDSLTGVQTLMTGPGFDDVYSGRVDKNLLRAEQGWAGPYDFSLTPNEFGGVWVGPAIGYYEFRDVPAGSYIVRIVMPDGYEAAPVATAPYADYASIPVTVTGGDSIVENIGIRNMQPVPQAGEVEGGVFDDVNLDFRRYSLLMFEKSGIPKIPVGVYDHLGYFMGSGVMGNPMCYANVPSSIDDGTGRSIFCPSDEAAVQKPEVERRAAPGVHIYRANDPVLVGHNHCYDPLDMSYMFDPGGFKFEADWSLTPTAINNVLGPGNGGINPFPVAFTVPCYLDNQSNLQSILPAEAPLPTHHTPGILGPGAELKTPGAVNTLFAGGSLVEPVIEFPGYEANLSGSDPELILAAPRQPPAPSPSAFTIHGSNFGSSQGYSTVSVGGVELKVVSWSDTQIEVKSPTAPDFPVGSPALVATSTGISSAIPVSIDYDAGWKRYLDRRTVYVQAGSAGGDGSKLSPYGTITEALNNLPVAKPRYVVVGPGVYAEKVKITESDIRLIGAGPLETVINGKAAVSLRYSGVRGSGPAVFIGKGGMSGGVSNIMISGFSIRGGSSRDGIGGGVFGDYGNRNLDINNSIIALNGGYYGGGIWLHHSNHDVKIWSNVISTNGNFGGYGGGISVNDEPEYTSHPFPGPDHIVDDNNPGPPPGTYRIFNNLIYHNWSPDYGGGICLYEVKDHIMVYGNMVMENVADDHGAGIYLEDTGPVDLYGNTFLRNNNFDDGGAISFEDVGDHISRVKIHDNLIVGNFVDDRGENTARGAAISFDDTFRVQIYNNIISGNIAAGSDGPTGGGIDSERNGHEYETKAPGYSNPVIRNNIIWKNWRLDYTQRVGLPEENPGLALATDLVWTEDNIHVDDPAVLQEWENSNDAQTLLYVYGNIISAGDNDYTDPAKGNSSIDPMFADPANFDWTVTNVLAKDKAPAGLLRIPVSILGGVNPPVPPAVP